MAQRAQQALSTPLLPARQALMQNRYKGWIALDKLFRQGSTPHSLPSDNYAGRFEAFRIVPGITQLIERVAAVWMPWQGKMLDPAQSIGYNILTNDSFPVVRLAAPSYRTFVPHSRATYCAFPFRTYLALGRRDPDLSVLKIDYDLPINPGLSVRRLQDELRQIDDNLYLGKAYFKWWWGEWQLWAYFSLQLSYAAHRGNWSGRGN